MKKILLILCCSYFIYSPFLRAHNSVDQLSSFIDIYEYDGFDDMGNDCLIDFFDTPSGALQIEVWQPRKMTFLLKPKDKVHLENNIFYVTKDPVETETGVATRSLIITRLSGPSYFSIKIMRRFCTKTQCWNSGKVCITD